LSENEDIVLQAEEAMSLGKGFSVGKEARGAAGSALDA